MVGEGGARGLLCGDRAWCGMTQQCSCCWLPASPCNRGVRAQVPTEGWLMSQQLVLCILIHQSIRGNSKLLEVMGSRRYLLLY